jgi:hypothetical protein
MQISIVSEMTLEELAQAIRGFQKEYVTHWEDWLATPVPERASAFGSILRKWQAGRPRTMRRTRGDGRHEAPFLEDLIAQAQQHLDALQDIRTPNLRAMQPFHRSALHALWDVFRNLTLERPATEVGISKAVLLLTNGRIGPAFDSNVRERLGIDRIQSPEDWISVLVQVGADIRGFEQKWGVSFNEAVPPEFRHLETGRLYDMVLGPRERRT